MKTRIDIRWRIESNVVESDLFAAIPPDSKFDVIAGNPPYIPSAEIDQLDAEVSKHEPRLALDGGADGLSVLRRVIDAAPDFAAPRALLLLEFTPEQASELEALVGNHGGLRRDFDSERPGTSPPRALRARFPIVIPLHLRSR